MCLRRGPNKTLKIAISSYAFAPIAFFSKFKESSAYIWHFVINSSLLPQQRRCIKSISAVFNTKVCVAHLCGTILWRCDKTLLCFRCFGLRQCKSASRTRSRVKFRPARETSQIKEHKEFSAMVWYCGGFYCVICFSAICLFSYFKKKSVDVKKVALFE